MHCSECGGDFAVVAAAPALAQPAKSSPEPFIACVPLQQKHVVTRENGNRRSLC